METSSTSTYKQIFGIGAVDLSEDTTPGYVQAEGEQKPSDAVFGFPTHVLPPLDLLASKFMDLLLSKDKDSDEEDDGLSASEEDSAMAESSDDDGAVNGFVSETTQKPLSLGEMAENLSADVDSNIEVDMSNMVTFFATGRPVPSAAVPMETSVTKKTPSKVKRSASNKAKKRPQDKPADEAAAKRTKASARSAKRSSRTK